VRFLLDTNACIDIIRKRPPHVLKEFLRHGIEDIGISAITLSELEYGVEKSSKPDQNKAALIEFLASLSVISYDHHAAAVYGKIRTALEKQGKSIGPLDILIGAHALAVKAILVTNNNREFERIPGLKVENWF
jgi:tRNA(fMet)-specific endonuclease VapC